MFAHARRLAPWWLPVAILCPSLVWLALDRSVWPWDQAWFARHTVELFETLRDDPLAWPAALSRATPSKPPAVAWIGQFFVPLGLRVGSVDAGLLLSVWACHLAALILVFRALLDLSGGRTLVAAAGTLVTGAAPIFIVLSTQYLAEASQTLAVAWFVLIMARAPRWSRSMLAAHLVAATSFAMLAKTTSPLYLAAPALVALAHLVRRRPGSSTPDRSQHLAAWPWWALAVLLATAGAAWYGRNLEATLHHAATAAFGPVAELYGGRDTFIRKFVAWCRIAAPAFFFPPVAALMGLLVVVASANRLFGRAAASARHPDICAGAASFQLLLALSAFAVASNRDPRYLAPLLPLVGVVVAWAIVHGRADWIAGATVGALGLQLALIQSQVLGLWPTRPAVLRANVGMAPELSVLHRNSEPARDLAAIVQRTCGHGGFGAHNFVGVDLLRLSGHSLTYAAAKERLAGRAGECHYDSIAFGSVELARHFLKTRDYVFWITVDPQVHPVPRYHEFLNRSAPVVFRQLRRRGVLQPEPWNGPTGVLLFRFVRR